MAVCLYSVRLKKSWRNQLYGKPFQPQKFLRLFEKVMFCSENRAVYEVFLLMNLMHLTELPQLGGTHFASILDEDRPAQ